MVRWSIIPLLVVGACIAYREASLAWTPSRPDVATGRDVPVQIIPRWDVPEAVSDEQLSAVLDRVKPPTGPPNTNVLLHALRLWGPEAEFDDPSIPSGQDMLNYFLDDAAFQRLAGESAPPLVSIVDQQICVRHAANSSPDETGAVHADDILATLAECGVPLSTIVRTRDGNTTVRQWLKSAMHQFNRQKLEYEWSAIGYARYLFPVDGWRNDHGESEDVRGLIDELVGPPLRQGVCGGTHRLEALVVLDRANEQFQGLSARDSKRISRHLSAVVRQLIASQHPEGYWTKSWSQGRGPLDESPAGLAERILATGHHLEWLALAPPDVLPPRETIVRAAQWLTRAMLEVDDATLRLEYGPFSHAARALALWRGREPFVAWQAGRTNKS